MQVMLLSSVEMARTQALDLQLRGTELIATGIECINNGQKQIQIALIDVTHEVKQKQLDFVCKFLCQFVHNISTFCA